MIQRHGEEEGLRRWNKYCERQAYAGCKKEYFIEKYGEEEGTEKYETILTNRSVALKDLQNKYGMEEGLKRFIDYNEKRIFNLNNNSTKSISEIQTIFIKLLHDRLQDHHNEWSIKDGIFSKEFHKWDNIYRKHYLYDFVVTHPFKAVIEFNGDYWHCNPQVYSEERILNFPKQPNICVTEIWEKDKRKIDCITREGYNVKIVWEKDFNQNPNKIVEECYQWLLMLSKV